MAADDVVKVGRLRLDVPDTAGLLTIDLTMTAGEITGTNHYATTVTTPRSLKRRGRTARAFQVQRARDLRFLNFDLR